MRRTAPETWDMRTSVVVENLPWPRETRKLSRINQASPPMKVPTTQTALLTKVSLIQRWERKVAETVIQKKEHGGVAQDSHEANPESRVWMKLVLHFLHGGRGRGQAPGEQIFEPKPDQEKKAEQLHHRANRARGE